MAKYMYPAVVYFDDVINEYAMAVYDVNVFADGKTMEEVYALAKSYLKEYVEIALELNGFVPASSSFEAMQEKYPDETVVMLEIDIDDGLLKKHLKKKGNKYTDIFEEDVDFLLSDEDMMTKHMFTDEDDGMDD